MKNEMIYNVLNEKEKELFDEIHSISSNPDELLKDPSIRCSYLRKEETSKFSNKIDSSSHNKKRIGYNRNYGLHTTFPEENSSSSSSSSSSVASFLSTPVYSMEINYFDYFPSDEASIAKMIRNKQYHSHLENRPSSSLMQTI
jgi:hypothetical protein